MKEDIIPIIFVNGEELRTFAIGDKMTFHGHSYEWEGERVVHLSTEPYLHNYGIHGNALFSKSKLNEVSDSELNFISYFIYVKDSNLGIEAEVSEKCDGKWISRPSNYIPAKQELYSRSKGILEVNILESKRVMIIGLGSFGSQIAIELAKAGVGCFSLFDFDK